MIRSYSYNFIVGFITLVAVARTDAIAQPANKPTPHFPATIELIAAEIDGATVDVLEVLKPFLKNGKIEHTFAIKDFGISNRGSGILTVTYKAMGDKQTSSFRVPDEVYVAAYSKEEAPLIDSIAEKRKAQPEGLLLLKAVYGGGHFVDVLDKLTAAVSGDSLQFPITNASLGDPQPGQQKSLRLIFSPAGNEVRISTVREGEMLQLGDAVTTITLADGRIVPLKQQVEQARKAHPTGLVVLSARFGADQRWKDCTQLAQDCVNGESLTFPADSDTLGDSAPGSPKRFELRYLTSDNEYQSLDVGDGEKIQIGPRRTSISGTGGIIVLDKRIAELRKKHPTGLLIIDARFGGGPGTADVTEKIQGFVKGNELTVPVNTQVLGDPNEGQSQKLLTTTYFDGKRVITVTTANDATLHVDENTVATVDENGLVIPVEARVATFKEIYGDGLVILDAQWGTGNQWGDVREIVQREVVDNSLAIDIGRGWPDYCPGAEKTANIVYWDGKEIRKADNQTGRFLAVGHPPEIIAHLKAPARFVAEGRPINHDFATKGKFMLIEGPEGAKVSPDGKLTWIPTEKQVGDQRIRISVEERGQRVVSVLAMNVIDRELAAALGGTESRLDELLQLPLGKAESTFNSEVDRSGGLILLPTELILVKGDGISVKKRVPMPTVYKRIYERANWYVALSGDKKRVDMLDKTTFKPKKSVKLPFYDLTDMVPHPTLPLDYVSVNARTGSGATFRVLVVDEEDASAREPKNVVGNFLAIDPAGGRLYTGYRDVYKKGVELFMNPDGRIWDSPRFGIIDILMVYDLAQASAPKLTEYKEQAGENGSGLTLSGDGKRLSYLSGGGYPNGSRAVPGWDPTDLQKLPSTYTANSKFGASRLTYHQSLPLCAAPGPNGPIFFERETGDEETDRIRLPEGILRGVELIDVYFSPDGLNALLVLEKGGSRWIYRAPLKLSDDERKIVERGPVLPIKPGKPADKNEGGGPQKA